MLNRVITLMQFFKRESCFDTSRDYHCFLLFTFYFFLQQFVGCFVDFLQMIMNKIWIQNRALNLSGHIFISRKLWIHQTGWMVFPLTYRTWAKSLFHFLMDTICSCLAYQNMLYIPGCNFFVKWLILEFDKEVFSHMSYLLVPKIEIGFKYFLDKFERRISKTTILYLKKFQFKYF